MTRRFYLQRNIDSSGVSGTGHVADGVEFPSGAVAVCWKADGKPGCVSIWESLADVETIHGHEGNTQIVWID